MVAELAGRDRLMLFTIILANSFYCVLAMIIMLSLCGITLWGRAFFLVEILLLIGIVFLELAIYRRFFGPIQLRV